jgi:DNA repair exonuclease SbcCD ATPase subunit
LSEYDELLEKARKAGEQFRSTAKEFIPKMYKALRNENRNISPEDARDRIEKDCVGIWVKRTILDALPDEAKNQEKQKAGRSRQKEHNSAAFSAATSAKRKIMVSLQSAVDTQDNEIRSNDPVTIDNPDYTFACSNSRYNNCNETEIETYNKIKDVRHSQEYEELLLENQKLKEELKRADDRFFENAQKDSKINDLEAEQKQLQRELEDKTAENAGLQKRIDHLKEELEKLGNCKNYVGDLVSSRDAGIDFEFSIPWEELHSYLTLVYKSGRPLRVWFHGRIDKQSGKVIVASPGRISELSRFALS